MATPKTLKEISRDRALGIIRRHPEGEWDGIPFVNGDFVYDGRMTKYGRRQEMVRVMKFGYGPETYEQGIVSD